MSDLAQQCDHCNGTGKVTLYGTYMGDADDQECPICSPPRLHRITAKRLESGWWHIRGRGPCNWAQPPHWPCSEQVLRQHAFPEASDVFIRSAMESIR